MSGEPSLVLAPDRVIIGSKVVGRGCYGIVYFAMLDGGPVAAKVSRWLLRERRGTHVSHRFRAPFAAYGTVSRFSS